MQTPEDRFSRVKAIYKYFGISLLESDDTFYPEIFLIGLGSIGMDCVINEPCYKGIIFQGSKGLNFKNAFVLLMDFAV